MPAMATAGLSRCALQKRAQMTTNHAPMTMLSTAPIMTGNSLHRALRLSVSASNRRLISVSWPTRRSRLCQEAFSSSSSMFFLREPAQAFLEPVDLGSEVGGGQPEDLRDLGQRALFQIEKQQSAVQRAQGFDEAAQDAASVA